MGRHGNEVAAFQDGAWTFLAPRPGWIAWIFDDAAAVCWNGNTWTELGAAVSALQDLALLGVGTTADVTNPFAAKLNKALWAAKPVSEGGDGDLRYTLNKEGASDVLSLLMQSGWSGRAEIGLIGDDDLTVKVSADGSNWEEALRIGNTTGNLRARSLTIGTDAPDDASFMTLVNTTADARQLDLYNEGNVGFRATRVTNNASSAVNTFRKARGTIASPTAVQSGDSLGSMNFNYYDGASWRVSAQMFAYCVAATPSVSDGESRLTFAAAAPGSVSVTEIMRLDHASGLSMFGANPVIDAKRHMRLRPYAVATLPSASPAGQLIYVSDGASNKRLAVSDGANWCWPDGAVVA